MTLSLPIGNGEVHVWSAPLGTDASGPDLSLLSPDEEERARRLRSPLARVRFVATRIILRRILAAYRGEAPESLEFRYAPHGKPALADRSASYLSFNISHSDDLLLVALARGRDVGVDLERISFDTDLLAIADRYLSPRETAGLRRLPPEARREAFYRCWVRKEAYAKGRGEGLTLPPNRFTVTVTPGEPPSLVANELFPSDTDLWRIADLSVPAGYVAAVAVAGEVVTIVARQWRYLPS